MSGLVTNQMLYEELVSIKREMSQIKNKIIYDSIEEISLNKAQKLLKLGSESIIHLVKSGKLKARVYRDNKRMMRYRFRIADIKSFQESTQYDHVSLHADGVETAEEIATRIFRKTNQRGK